MMPINNTFLGIVMYGGTLVKKKKLKSSFYKIFHLPPMMVTPSRSRNKRRNKSEPPCDILQYVCGLCGSLVCASFMHFHHWLTSTPSREAFRIWHTNTEFL